ncbi:MAG: DUF4421 family protein [Flavobacteriales bacterium]|nr:DUF4421 domain-containing protein [Flavobacteriales bacterium]MCL4282749.1 DUF4421 family protein [Flavobacteriales bacterium]
MLLGGRVGLFRLFLFLAAWSFCLMSHAEDRSRSDGFDSAYVHDYSHMLTGRFYVSTKYNKLKLGGLGGVPALVYKPNNKVNFGLGASYRSITLNIGVGIPGLNKDQDEKGETKYLDAQATIHTKRWATNLFLQRFQGYYLEPYTKEELVWQQSTWYPTRPDLVQYNLGVSTVHVLNNDRFSYRAAFNQDAWQRKSQGTPLVGGYFTYFHLKADSSLVPDVLAKRYETGLHLRRGGFMDVGASLGYAYTLVVQEHWFITASLVFGGGLSAQRAALSTGPEQEELRTSAGLGWHSQYRAGAGYNSERYFAGISINQENIGYVMGERDSFYWSVGNIRLNIAKRIGVELPSIARRNRVFGGS